MYYLSILLFIIGLIPTPILAHDTFNEICEIETTDNAALYARASLALALDVLAAKLVDLQMLMIELTIDTESYFDVVQSSIEAIT